MFGNLTRVEKEQRDQQPLLRELVRCALSLLKAKRAPKDAWQRLVLCLDPKSSDPATRVLIMDYMSVLTVSRPEFYEELLASVEYFKFCKV